MAYVFSHKVSPGHFHQLTTAENTDGLQIFADQACDGGFAGAGIPSEDHVHGNTGSLQPLGFSSLLHPMVFFQAEDIDVYKRQVHALRDAKPGPEDCCVILGAGTIGLLCLVAAGKIAGFSKVICTDTAPFNRELALRLGAAAAYDPLQENAEEEILRQTGGGAALTVVAAGAKDILNQASRVTRKCGEIRLCLLYTSDVHDTTKSLWM